MGQCLAWLGRRSDEQDLLLFIAAVGRDDGLYTARYQIYIRSYLPVGSCVGY
jgi:hypothetical protein